MNKVEHVFYINLDSRPDRNQFCLQQLSSIGVPNEKIERFSAIKNKEGAIGCTLSHIKCLKLAIEKGYENVMIVEDDIHFTKPVWFKEQFEKLFEYDFDVNLFDFEKIDQHMIRVLGANTTTGYLVQKHYYQKLLDNYKQGLELLLRTGNKPLYAIDSYALRTLHHVDNWITFSLLTVTQVESYSDIEKRFVNYDAYMLKNIETIHKTKYRLP